MKNYKKQKMIFYRLIRYVGRIACIKIIRKFICVIRGYHVYTVIKKEYGSDTRLLVLPWNGTGDAVYFGQSFSHLFAPSAQRKYVAVVWAEAGKKILEMFGIRRCKAVGVNNRNYLTAFAYFSNIDKQEISFVHYAPNYHTSIMLCVEGINGMNYFDMYSAAGFQFRRTRPESGSSVTDMEELIVQNGAQVGKTVLLSPYANTVKPIEMRYWSDLAEKLKENGFSILTNADGKEEAAIPGTRAVLVPYKNLIPFLEAAGWFVGYRSGLCDLAVSAHCNKYILYPQKKRGVSGYSEFYDLSSFPGCNRPLSQFVIQEGKEEQTIDTVIKAILGTL